MDFAKALAVRVTDTPFVPVRTNGTDATGTPEKKDIPEPWSKTDKEPKTGD